MKLTISLYHLNDLDAVLSRANCDVIIGCSMLSSDFSHSLEEMHETAKKCLSQNIDCFLQWDLLMTDDDFKKALVYLKEIKLQLFSGIRVKDPGALYYFRKFFPEMKVHFIAESGNHNEVGLLSWINTFSNITRIVLSPELSYDLIKELRLKIDQKIELEVLGMGMVLLFYTPRPLLTPVNNQEVDHLWALGTSEESPHRGFPLLENRHGTYMFNTKDIFIFDEREKVHELSRMGVLFRLGIIDGPLQKAFDMICCDDSDSLKKIKSTFKRPFIKGFFRTNKTDVLFKKLKNSRIQNRDESFLGEVVEVKKKVHVGLFIKDERSLHLGETIRFFTPEGKEKLLTIKEMKNAIGEKLEKASGGQVVFFPPVGGVSVRTLVHKTQG